MTFTFRAASQVPPEGLHRAFTDAFSDYLIGPFDMPFAQWPVLLGRQAVDLDLSRVAFDGDSIAAFAFVAPRSDLGIWRLATMGAPPSARGKGAAPQLLDDFIERASAAGCGTELECFEQNGRALKLYRSRGFEVISPLYGYSKTGEAAQSGANAVVVDREDAFRWIDEFARARKDLPLQVTPVSLKALPVDLQALRRGGAQLVWSVHASGAVTVHSLIDRDPAQVDAQALSSHLLSQNTGQRVSVPQLQRPDVGGDALERAGFDRLPFNQVMMRRIS